jgi:sugar/nucleoside kinase (ribokinase family)
MPSNKRWMTLFIIFVIISFASGCKGERKSIEGRCDYDGVKIEPIYAVYFTLQDGTEKKFCSIVCASMSFSKLKKEVKEVLSTIKFLVVMDTPLDFTHAILCTAAKRPIPRLWAPGVRTLQGKAAVTRLLKYVDFLVLNEPEVMNLGGASSVSAAFRELRRHQEDLKLIVTRGKEGALMLGPGTEEEIGGVDLASLGLKAVNTVGCGDAFIGCFAVSIVLGRSPEEALKMANYAGSFKATKMDTRGSPTADELMAFVKRIENPKS